MKKWSQCDDAFHVSCIGTRFALHFAVIGGLNGRGPLFV